MNIAKKTCLIVLTSSLVSSGYAAESTGEEIIQVKKSTFVNLVDLLVKRGVINKDEGKGLVSAAEQEAADAKTNPQAKSAVGAVEAPVASSPGSIDPEQAQNAAKTGIKTKHVGYVPEFVKKEIHDQVKAELKAEVVQDVKQDAKTEGWGIPAALPEWVSALNPTVDMRVRLQDSFFDPNNGTALNQGYGPFNFLNINSQYVNNGQETGVAGAASVSPGSNRFAFNNNTKDQFQLRERFRLGFEANITESIKAGVRLATSNNYSPVSNDQSLGNTGQSYQFAIDRSYLQYDYFDDRKNSWFSAYAGRIINPFMSTDIVFDPDLSFEGVAGSFRFHFNQNDASVLGYKPGIPTGRVGINQGQQTPDSVFMTFGVFPIQNVNFSTNSKWLYAGQLGADWLTFNDSRFNIGVAYYEYQNVSARYNAPGVSTGHEYDWTAPQFMQQGNSVVAITNFNSSAAGNGSGSLCTDVTTGCLFGLASQFRIFNATSIYDYLLYGQTHLVFTADYAKNLGYNQQNILNQFKSGVVNYTDTSPHTTAYQMRVDLGHPRVARRGDWNMSFAYRYVERDAVLDAFTDSIFHNGGTNARGWVLGAQYAMAKNTWMDLHWYATSAINGPTYNVDTVNVDVNTRF